MIRVATVLCLCVCLAGCASSPASAPQVARAAPPDATASDDPNLKTLETTLRTLLLANIPDPLVQSDRGWGQMKVKGMGGSSQRDGPSLESNPTKGMRNDGMWRRVAVKAVNPAQTLTVALTDSATPEAGRTTFTARIGIDCAMKFEQQLWRNGIRLYSGETRGRCHATAILRCEVTSRTETKPGNFLPDMVFRMRVTDAQLFYDNLVIEHTAGLGGDAAKLFGEAVVDTVKRLKPDLERDLLAKANKAVVKAADTKEVRISFEALLKGGSGFVQRKK